MYISDPMKYSAEQLNFFRLLHIVFDIIPEGLRTFFKQKWDALYATAHGQWDDKPASYNVFKSMETPKNKKYNKDLLKQMSSGNRDEWDCKCLFYAILRSNSIGPTIDAVVKSSVDDLRETRNVFAHPKDDKLSDVEFRLSIQKIKVAFSSLKINATKIEEVENQADFTTKQVVELKKELRKAKRDLELEKEKRREPQPNSFCVLPPRPSHDILERKNEVKEVLEAMQQLSSKKGKEIPVVYLSGIPGSGKSVMARNIGHEWYNSNDTKETLKFVVTLDASSLGKLLNSYTIFARNVNCNEEHVNDIITSTDLSKHAQILKLKALVSTQLTKYSSWLIIVDNAIDVKSVSKYWPQSGEKTFPVGKGQILVTTQDASSIDESSSCYHVSLKRGMPENDAIKLLSELSGYADEEIDIMRKVVEVLDLQPLAIISTAVYVQRIRTKNNQYTWNHCLEDLKKERERVEEDYKDKINLTYKDTMTAAVNLALQREMNNEIMLHAFHFLSVLESDPIPLQYVVGYVAKCMPGTENEVVAGTIRKSSLVLSLNQEKNEMISIHQVVYHCLTKIAKRTVNTFTVVSVFSALLPDKDKELIVDLIAIKPFVNHFVKIAKEMISFVLEYTESDSIQNYYISDVLLDYLSSVLLEYCISDEAKHFLQVRLALQLHPTLQVRESLIALRNKDAKTFISNISDGIHLYVAHALYKLGIVHHHRGQWQEAIACYEKAFAINTGAYTKNETLEIEILKKLGSVYCEKGKFMTSITSYEKALVLTKAQYNEHHPFVGCILNDIGIVYQTSEQLQKSVDVYKNALVIYRAAIYGEHHPSIGQILENLGTVYRQLARFKESKKNLERALSIFSAAYGEDHPSVANTMRTLGVTYGKIGRSQEAITHYKKALAIYKAVYGDENHPSVADTLNNLGNAYQDQGQLHESITHHKKALTIYKAVYGDENHPSVADTLNNLGNAYQDQGQLQESITHYERALAIHTAVYGNENHPSVAATLNNLGNAYQNQGKLQESITHYERALAIHTAVYGNENHPSVVNLFSNLRQAYEERGRQWLLKIYTMRENAN
ncbi:uncharacterized protein LOC110251966 isoform X1 [Exaiptasia diaphana]|uniref:Nephrocystin-3 n=2 Tax=Exaiptasia diaphana TaxID=2652724 RepID=A0A913Y343_EXADI|nr:uncharacterized protein LOC110251966 isoform X1 [Exaiptasia diaphana]